MTTVSVTPLNGNVVERFSGDFDQCIDFRALQNPKRYASKKQCPLFQFAELGKLKSAAGSYRNWANVITMHAVVGDYDGGVVPLDEAADMLDGVCDAAFYTTPSHRREEPRWRVIAPLTKPVEPNAILPFSVKLNTLLGGILAPESADFARGFFFGAITGQDYQFRRVYGELP